MKEQQGNVPNPGMDTNPPASCSGEAWEKRPEGMEQEYALNKWSEKKLRPPFIPDRTDGIFALIFLVLGYLFLRWWVILGSGIRMGVFAALYIGVILGYLSCKKQKPAKESWFWLAVLSGCALGYVLWSGERNDGGWFWLLHLVFLLSMAVYWVLSATGALVQGRTGNWMPLDMLRGFIKLPFKNFGCLFQSLYGWLKKLRQGRNLLAFLLGLFLCIPVLGIVLPLLIDADKGFAALIDQMFRELAANLLPIVLYGLFGIPVGCYLFGLVCGGIHKQYTGTDLKELETSSARLRVLPMVSIYTLLCIIGAVYVVFVCVQAGNLFSAFAGRCPEGYGSYAEYAREGFFELCKVAAFNGMVLLAVNVFSRYSCRERLFLRVCNLFLAVTTLLLLVTAMSKMALYVDVYGLSVRRLLPSWFMIFLGLCCVMVIVLQWKRFSIVRGIAVLGSVMFVMLCLTDVDGLTAGYNLRRYQEGTLPSFSVDFLYDCGIGGVKSAVKLYQETADEDLRAALKQYLENMQCQAEYVNDTWTVATVQSYQAEALLSRTLGE